MLVPLAMDAFRKFRAQRPPESPPVSAGAHTISDFTLGLRMDLDTIVKMEAEGWAFAWPDDAPSILGGLSSDTPVSYRATKGAHGKGSLPWYADLCRVLRLDESHIPEAAVKVCRSHSKLQP